MRGACTSMWDAIEQQCTVLITFANYRAISCIYELIRQCPLRISTLRAHPRPARHGGVLGAFLRVRDRCMGTFLRVRIRFSVSVLEVHEGVLGAS